MSFKKNSKLEKAKQILNSFKKKEDWSIKQARRLFAELEKGSASIPEIVQSPYYQNIVNILGPYAIYYKIDQVLKLLKELEQQSRQPEIAKSPYFARPITP